MASRLSVEPEKLLSALKATVFKGASNEELLALVVVSNTYGLSPLLREIYAFPSKGGGIVPIVSIDGWIRMTNDHPQFDGMELDVEFDAGKPVAATCKIHRKDRTRPTIVTEYFSECFRNTDPWRQFPARMLRHKALCQCARVAFGFAGVMDREEFDEWMMRDVTPGTPYRGDALPAFQYDGSYISARIARSTSAGRSIEARPSRSAMSATSAAMRAETSRTALKGG
jgi:phage recombination protein Bet